jgi:hypothetical protein
MAIDQEIQQKVDAYRNNPQALQQRYAQNQQLVDLLALQKIKSEMDAAKRDIEMKMQQQPGTIKQQREQELMERTKQDMMDQTAGVMRQKQAQQQQNLQKVAQGGLGALAPQRPPAPGPAQQIANQSQPMPRMAAGGAVTGAQNNPYHMQGMYGPSGMDNQGTQGQNLTPEEIQRLRQMANQSQSMPRMATGGIVAFQQGRGVSGLSSMPGLSDADIAGMTPERLAELRRTDPERYRTIRNELARRQREAGSDYSMYGGEAGRTDTDAIARERPQRPSLLSRGLQSLNLQGSQSIVPGSTALPPEQGPDVLGPETFAPTVARQGPEDFAFGIGADAAPRRAGGIEALVPTAGPDDGLRDGPAEPTATEADVGPVAGGAGGAGGASGIASIGGGSAEAAMERGFARADQYTGRQEKADRYAELESQLAALDAEYDPAQARRDELVSFLIGTGGRGSTALAGGAAAALGAEARNRKERRDNLLERINLAERGMTTDTNLSTLGMQLGREMYAQVSMNNRQAASDAAAMSREQLRDTRERAKMEADQRQSDRDEAYRRDSLEIERAQAVADDRNATITAASGALARMETLRENEIARQESKLGVAEMQTRLNNAMVGEDTTKLQADIATASRLAAVTANEILAANGFFDAQEGLILKLQEEGLTAPAAPTEDDLESIAFNPIGTTQ